MQKLPLFVFRGRHVPLLRNRRCADLVIIKFVRNTHRRIHEVNCAAPITQSALLVTREEFTRFEALDGLNRQIIVGVDVLGDPYDVGWGLAPAASEKLIIFVGIWLKQEKI